MKGVYLQVVGGLVGLATAAAVLVTTYDPVVARAAGETRREEQNVSCTHLGYCMACGLGMHGSYDCSPKFKYNCPGTQPALVDVTPVTLTYESGKLRIIEETRTVQTLGSCQ